MTDSEKILDLLGDMQKDGNGYFDNHVPNEKIANYIAQHISLAREGYWIENGSYRKCSICNQSVCERDDFGDKQCFNFCPFCGAKNTHKKE